MCVVFVFGVGAKMQEESALLINKEEDTKEVRGVRRWGQLVWTYLLLGLVSFGGPQAHMAVLRVKVVDERKWMSTSVFGDLMALCSAIPGPSSSQLVTAVGIVRCGWFGGIVAYTCFFAPGFIVMLTLGVLANLFEKGYEMPFYLAGAELGLSAAALVLIGANALSLGQQLCYETMTRLICLAALCVALLFNAYWFIFPAIFAGAGIASFVYFSIRPAALKASQTADVDVSPDLNYGRVVGALIFAISCCTLIVLIVLSSTILRQNEWMTLAEIFYRIGFTVFGGGNVILSMFLTELVPAYISNRQFLVGFALVGLLPGPVFNFSLYVGTVMGGPIVGLLCWLSLNLPGISLVYALLPYWVHLRKALWFRKLFAGLNAAAVAMIALAYIQFLFRVINFSYARALLHVLSWGWHLIFQLQAQYIVLGGGVQGLVLGTIWHFGNFTGNEL